MSARQVVRLYPFPVSLDGTVDLPADAPPICAVRFGHRTGAVDPVPVMVWVPFVERVYDDEEAGS